jgi:hypothetical protein
MSKDKKNKVVVPPKEKWKILVEPGGGNGTYPKWELFWELQMFNQEESDRRGKAFYHHVAHGLALTKWGLRRTIKKEIKRIEKGYTGYTLNLKELG